MRIFQTERLKLIPLEKSDDENLYSLTSDPDVMKFIRKVDTDIFQAKKKVKELLEYSLKFPDYGMWMIRDLKTEEFIGFVILINIDLNPNYPVEIGYRLHKKFWNKGFATEAASEIKKYAEEELKINICAITIQENLGSQNVLNKLGLKYKEDRIYYETEVMYFE